MRKIPFAGIELTSQRVRGFRGTSELPGRPTFIDYDIFVIVVLRRQEYTINTTNAFTYSTEFTTVHSWIIIFLFYFDRQN